MHHIDSNGYFKAQNSVLEQHSGVQHLHPSVIHFLPKHEFKARLSRRTAWTLRRQAASAALRAELRQTRRLARRGTRTRHARGSGEFPLQTADDLRLTMTPLLSRTANGRQIVQDQGQKYGTGQ